jgi:hypothetical protein
MHNMLGWFLIWLSQPVLLTYILPGAAAGVRPAGTLPPGPVQHQNQEHCPPEQPAGHTPKNNKRTGFTVLVDRSAGKQVCREAWRS